MAFEPNPGLCSERLGSSMREEGRQYSASDKTGAVGHRWYLDVAHPNRSEAMVFVIEYSNLDVYWR